MRTKPSLALTDVAQFHGEFQVAPPTGAVTTIAAGGVLAALRWGDTSGKRMLLRYLYARFVLTTAFGAGQEVGCEAYVGRVYTANHTGGTAVTLTGNNAKRRKDGTTSAVTDMRVATTSALGGGTVTLDSSPFASASGFAAAVGLIVPDAALFDASTLLDPAGGFPVISPIELQQDEGIIIRNAVLMGASGAGRWSFAFGWDEITP